MKSVAIGLPLAAASLATPALADDTGLMPYAGVLVGFADATTSRLGLKDGGVKLAYGIALGADTVVAPRTRLGLEFEYMRSKPNTVLPIDALNSLNVGYRRDWSRSTAASV